MRPRLTHSSKDAKHMHVGASNRCIAATLATRSGSQWSCSTSCGCSSVRLPTGGGALVRFDFQKWLPRMDSRYQPPGSEPGALAVELQGKTIRQPELHRSLADTSGVRRYQRFGGIENGRAPRCCPECLPLRRLRRWRSAFRRRTLSRHEFADPNGADCCLPHAGHVVSF